MQGPFIRRRGRTATIDFNLFEVDGVDFRVDAVHAAGDTKVMKDEGVEGNTTNGFTDEGQGYSLVLTDTEMQASRIMVHVVDQTATKVWLDTSLVVETFEPPGLLQTTDIATLASQTSFTLAEGSADNDAYNGQMCVVTDATTQAQKAVGVIKDYTGSTKTVTLAADPGIFTMAAGDYVDIIAANANVMAWNGIDLATTNPLPNAAADAAGGLPISDAGGLDMDAVKTDTAAILVDTGTAGVVVAAGSKTGYSLAADQSGVTIGTCTTNTDMRGTDGALLAASAPTNFGDLAITITTGRVTVGTNTDKTGYAISGTKTTLDALNDISVADVLTTQMTEAYAADGAAPTMAQALMMCQQMLGEFAISGTTLTLKKLDGATTAATFTLNDATNPTSITRAT